MRVWEDGLRRISLPIDDRLDEIVEMINDHQVVIVVADTGAGKTTRIPQALLLNRPDEQIFLTQPRRNAVRWNGRRIAGEMGEEPGGVVGWRLFGEEPIESDWTRLTLMVDQSLANTIRHHHGRLPQGLAIIDEAHERGIPTDLLLGLVKEGLPKAPETRVIVMSATIDAEKFSAFFDNAPILNIPGRCYPVETKVFKLDYAEHHTQGAARASVMVLQQFLKDELTVPTELGEAIVQRGTVIVLLPGKEDIAQAMSNLRWEVERIEGAKDRVQIMSCHGESSPDEQDAVQTPVPAGTIRFVCATEVLRTSVTLPEVICVIDSLQIKRPMVDEKGVTHLSKISISRAEADQARGRAGRTNPGIYIPVSYGQEFEILKPHPTPAILLGSVESVALQVAAIGRSLRNFPLLDPPDPKKVEMAMTRLKRLGALNDAEEITEIGDILVQFPVDPERAKVLLIADQLGVLSEAVVVVAALESEGFFFRPKNDAATCQVSETIAREMLRRIRKDSSYSWREVWQLRDTGQYLPAEEVDLENLPEWMTRTEESFEIHCQADGFPHRDRIRWVADIVRRVFANSSQSDFVAIVRAYRAFKAEEQRLKEAKISGRERQDQLFAWCSQNFINFKRIRMAEDIMHQIREELENSPLRLENGLGREREFSYTDLTKALAAGMIDDVARRSSSGERQYEGPRGQFNLAWQTVCPGNSGLILASAPTKVPVRGRRGSTGFILLADLAAPVQPDWLPEVMPQLCSTEYLSDFVYDHRLDKVVRTQVDRFVDLEVRRERVEAPASPEAAQALARALVENEKDSNSVLHPAVAHNRHIRARLKQLWHRSLGQTKYPSDGEVLQVLADRLGTVTSLKQADEQGINLRLSVRFWVSEADEEATLEMAPPFFVLKGHICTAQYEYIYYSTERPDCGTLTIEEEAAIDLTPNDLPTNRRFWSFRITRNGQFIDQGNDLAELQGRIEERRIEQAWQESKALFEGQLLLEDLWTTVPALGSAFEYTKTNRGQGDLIFGYVGLDQYWSSQPYLKVFKDSAEAQSATGRVLPTLAVQTIPNEDRTYSSGGYDFYKSVQGQLKAAVDQAQSRMGWLKIIDAAGFQQIIADLKAELTAIRQEADARLEAKQEGEAALLSEIEETTTRLQEQRSQIDSSKRYFVESLLLAASEKISWAKQAVSVWRNTENVLPWLSEADQLSEQAVQDAAEFDQWLAKGQEMFVAVEALTDQIDWEKPAAYGLTEAEVYESQYSSSNGLRGQLKAVRKLAFGDESTKLQPKQAIEALTRLEERLATAISFAAENEGARDAAQAVIEHIKAWRAELHEPYCDCRQWGDNAVFEHAQYRELFGDRAASAEKSFEAGNCLAVVALTEELLTSAASLESLAGVKKASQERLQALLAAEYSTCPACGQSWEPQDGSNCYCLKYEEVESGLVIKRSQAADSRLLVSANVDRGSEVHLNVHDRNIPELSEIVSETLWTPPNEEENRRRRFEQDLAQANQDMSDGRLIELKFRIGRNPKTGEEQWEAGGRKVKYLLDRWCHYTPVERLVYFCSLGKNLVNTGQFELWTVHIVPPYPEEAPEDWSKKLEEADEESDEIEEEVETSISNDDRQRLQEKFGRK